MGKEKYQERIRALFERSPVISSKSIEMIVRGRKKTKQYAKQLIRNLILKGKIKKLAKGCYTAFGDASLAVFCFKPAYLGLQDSLSAHGLWEQETIPIVVTARKVRQGMRTVMGGNVLLRRIDKKYVFGIEYLKCGGFYLPYSDTEKTFIDMVYFRERLGEDTLKTIRKKIDKKKLRAYLDAYPKRFRKKVLAYL